jgi:hypothetical protein
MSPERAKELGWEWKGTAYYTQEGTKKNSSLTHQVQNPQWATPSNGKLNPRWVETLMGLPIGWTMQSCATPVTIGQMNCECWGTE